MFKTKKENERLKGQVDFYKNSVEINKNLNEMQKLNNEMYKENQAIKSKIDNLELPHFEDIHKSGQNFILSDEQIKRLKSMIKWYEKNKDVWYSDIVRILGNQEWKVTEAEQVHIEMLKGRRQYIDTKRLK